MEVVVNGVGESKDDSNGLEDGGHAGVLAIEVTGLVTGGAGSRGGAVGETLVEVNDLGHLWGERDIWVTMINNSGLFHFLFPV